MDTKVRHALTSTEIVKFLGLKDKQELLTDFDFEVVISGELCPPSDKLVRLIEGVDVFSIDSVGGIKASGKVLYSSNLNGFDYEVTYSRYAEVYFPVNLDELISFEGQSKEFEFKSEELNFPLGYNHYDLDEDTYRLTQAGYDAILEDFVNNVEPSRNSNSVKWLARVTVSKQTRRTSTELTEEEISMLAHQAYRELVIENSSKFITGRTTLSNRKRATFRYNPSLAGEGIPKIILSKNQKALDFRMELAENKTEWRSKNVVFAGMENYQINIELVVTGVIEGEGLQSNNGSYEVEVLHSNRVKATIKTYPKDNKEDISVYRTEFNDTPERYILRLNVEE